MQKRIMITRPDLALGVSGLSNSKNISFLVNLGGSDQEIIEAFCCYLETLIINQDTSEAIKKNALEKFSEVRPTITIDRIKDGERSWWEIL